MKKENLITIGIIIGIIIIAFFAINNKPNTETSKEIAKCIGENSILYVQLGCPHCETQEKMFGENYQYLNTIDCFYDRKSCSDAQITGTPTWIIKGKKYSGVQEIEKIRELTNC